MKARFGAWLAAALAPVLAMTALPERAQASGFDFTRIGGERGHATTPTPFAAYFNPAALANTKKIHIAGDLTLVFHNSTYDRTQSTVPEPADAQGANTGKATLNDVLVAPSLAGSMKFGDFAVGLMLLAPMSGSQAWNGNSKFDGNTMYPGAQDGTARWQMIQGDQIVLYTALAASYTIPKLRLSFGAGVNLIYQSVRLLRARTGRGDDALPQEGRINMDVSGLSASFSLGTQWEALKDKLWIGLSYQAPPGMYGGMKLQGTLESWLHTGTPGTEDVELQQKLPDIIRWGLRFREPRYELRLFGDVTRWSVVDKQCLVDKGTKCDLEPSGAAAPNTHIVSSQIRNWNNSFSIRAGASYWFMENLEGFVGFGYGSNAIPAGYLEPGTIDGQTLSGSLGGRITIGDHVGLLLQYTYMQTLKRTVKNSKLDELDGISRLPTGAGDYTQAFSMLNGIAEFYFN
ncbi:MAG: outer membrane protein transport protein [Myxococcales bacterium]